MLAARRSLPLVIGAIGLALAGCSADDGDDGRLDPDPAGGVLDEEVDEDTVITDPGGVANNLDGLDGDIEDRQGDGDE